MAKPSAKAPAKPPVVVRVGNVRISDKVVVESAPLPQQVAVRPGQAFVLEVPYKLHEASDDKESYLFSLQCTVGEPTTGTSPTYRKPVVDQWEDHWGRKDDRAGLLRDEIVIPTKGDYAIEYTIEAAYTRGDWGKSRLAQREVRKAAGLVRVHVDGQAA